MPPALKICGSALIPHSFSINASSAFASLFIQQWDATLPFKPCTTSMPGSILPPLKPSWLRWSVDLGHHCSYLLRFRASPKPGSLHISCTASWPAEHDSARAVRPVFPTVNRLVSVQPRNWGSSPRSRCFVTLPWETRSLLGLAVLLQELECFVESLPEQPVAQGRQSLSSVCVTTGPALSISSLR